MRYANPYQSKVNRSFFHFLLWYFGCYKENHLLPLPNNFSFPNPIKVIDTRKPCVTWINHSTFWIRAFETSLLFDPIWSQRCSPCSFIGPKRLHLPSISLDEISSLDAVIISHNHYDHLDYYTIEYFYKKFPKLLWVVPIGVKKWFYRYFSNAYVQELVWWERITHHGINFTSVPAQHFSGRGLFDRNKTLWMGCVIEFTQGKRIYFSGDTGYNPFDFKEINKRFFSIDLSLIPIGAYQPRMFMRAVHVNPNESVQIHIDIGSKLSVASHWGTFRLSSEEIARPPYDLFLALKKFKISCNRFRVLLPGQTINW
ncbi:MAG: MBL fold metallo-hydrolase [Chlamydiales bacterium]